MQVLVSCVLKTIQLRPKNCKGAHSRVPYRAATLKQYQLLLWGRLECHVMHKVQAIALRSDKHTVETKLRSPYSVISSPFARWSYAHNRIGDTVISRLRLHWHLSKSNRCHWSLLRSYCPQTAFIFNILKKRNFQRIFFSTPTRVRKE